MTNEPSAEVIEIAQDWPCRKCGYNLRGACVDGVCPECAEKVAASMAVRPQPTWGAIGRAALVVLVLFITLVVITSAAGSLPAAQIISNPLEPTFNDYGTTGTAPAMFAATLTIGTVVLCSITTAWRTREVKTPMDSIRGRPS